MIARVAVTMLVIGCAFVSAVTPAWAGGPGDNPSCVIPKKGGAALVGTISAGVQNALTQGNGDVDFTLRLSGDGGKTFTFFRASVNMQVYARSNAGIICTLLFENVPQFPAPPQAALDLRAAILSHFNLSPTAQFFITSKSVTNDEVQGSTGQWFCNNTFTDSSLLAGPCNPQRAGSMADVILYVQ